MKNCYSLFPAYQMLVLFFLFPPVLLFTQDCAHPTAITLLNTNNVRALLPGAGSLWWDGLDGGYFFPNDDTPGNGPIAIYAGGLWMGGFDPAGNLKVAAAGYGRGSGQTDYWPGPLSQVGITTIDHCANFDRFWQVTGVQIDAHQADWADNGQIDGQVPPNILGWPGQGNPHFEGMFGFLLPSTPQGLAPFFDVDADGVYDPMKGDLPDIHGADQGIWWVFNDNGGVHSESNGDALQFEVQALAYAYASSEDAINNATFYDFKFINRAIESIDSAYVGLWIDHDLGCTTNDFFGSDPDRDLVFVYNEEQEDGELGNCQCFNSNVQSYCDTPPVLAIKVLEGTKRIDQNTGQVMDNGLSNFMYYNHSFNTPPGTSAPQLTNEFYHYLTGSWRDGTPLTKGGSGYDPASTDVSHHVFSNPPNDPGGWSMCTEPSIPEDRRILLSSGPFELPPGAVNSLRFAVLMVPDISLPCPDLAQVYDACQKVETFLDVVSSTEEIAGPVHEAGFSIGPNPMNQNTFIELHNPSRRIRQLQLFAIDGRQLRSYTNPDSRRIEIERGHLAAGLYIIRLTLDNGREIAGKLVVE